MSTAIEARMINNKFALRTSSCAFDMGVENTTRFTENSLPHVIAVEIKKITEHNTLYELCASTDPNDLPLLGNFVSLPFDDDLFIGDKEYAEIEKAGYQINLETDINDAPTSIEIVLQ